MSSKIIFFISILLSHSLSAQEPYFPTYNPETESWEILDVTGNLALSLPKTDIEDIHSFSEGLAAVQDKSTHLWGFIDQKGNWKIKPQYNNVEDFLNGYSIVSKTCTKNCYQGEEGLLDTDMGFVINEKNEIVFSDRSQDENPNTRFFLDKNLGEGLFRITYGYGLADMKTLVNLQGKELCDVYSVFGRGDIEYDPELNIFKCWGKFYKPTGEMVLNLEKYAFVGMFHNGYLWASEEEVLNDEETISWNVLIDSVGKIIGRFNSNDYAGISDVENGKFTYSSADYVKMEYDIANKKQQPYTSPYELDYDLSVGCKLKNGVRLVRDFNEMTVGFITTEGVFISKMAE